MSGRQRTVYGGISLLLALTLLWLLRPETIPVTTALITKGPLEVTIDEEGVTVIRDIYTVSSPIAGRLLRNPLKAGDEVKKGETVVGIIEPVDPSLLDNRTRQETSALVKAAKASVKLTEEKIKSMQSELEFSRANLKRARRLAVNGTITKQDAERAEMDTSTKEASVASAKAELEIRQQELASAEAKLIEPRNLQEQEDEQADGANTNTGKTTEKQQCCIKIPAPENGRILKVLIESQQVIQAGTALLEIGNPANMEILVELLSSDAVKIKEGAPAYINHWGGSTLLQARVRLIEPAGFKKISALGIEEQRVRVRLDITSPYKEWDRLGHDYRIFARISSWKSEDSLRIPISALFRQGDHWAVFLKSRSGRAKLQNVEIGERNFHFAQLLKGVHENDRVILHPSDRIADDVRVIERNIHEKN